LGTGRERKGVRENIEKNKQVEGIGSQICEVVSWVVTGNGGEM